jgi:hypothetical protein
MHTAYQPVVEVLGDTLALKDTPRTWSLVVARHEYGLFWSSPKEDSRHRRISITHYRHGGPCRARRQADAQERQAWRLCSIEIICTNYKDCSISLRVQPGFSTARERDDARKPGRPGKKTSDLLPQSDEELLGQLKERVRSAQLRAGLAVKQDLPTGLWVWDNVGGTVGEFECVLESARRMIRPTATLLRSRG